MGNGDSQTSTLTLLEMQGFFRSNNIQDEHILNMYPLKTNFTVKIKAEGKTIETAVIPRQRHDYYEVGLFGHKEFSHSQYTTVYSKSVHPLRNYLQVVNVHPSYKLWFTAEQIKMINQARHRPKTGATTTTKAEIG